MDNRKIKQILEELYKIDKSFTKHESDLVKIIQKLLANKPEIKINNVFIKKLRGELMESVGASSSKNLNIININYMKKFSYIFGGVAVTAVLFLLIYNFLPGQPGGILKPDKIAFAPGEVKKLSDNAFGALSDQRSTLGSPEAISADATAAMELLERPQSGGGGGVPSPGLGGGGGMDMARAVSSVMDGKMVEPQIYPYPGPVIYKFVYNGAGFELENEKMTVYRKDIKVDLGKNISGLLGNIDLNLVDLNKFPDSILKNFRLSQDKELGYDIYVDLEAGVISINNNNNGWYETYDKAVCDGIGCGDSGGLKISDVPSDDKLIAIADKFIRDKNIDISHYGQPKVDNDWRRDYDLRGATERIYIPNVLSVSYPLVIDGNEVRDMGGNDYGLRININIEKGISSGLYGLGIHNFESSLYDTVTDKEKVLKMAENGGYGYYYTYDNAQIVEMELGEPTLNYVSYMRWTDGKNEELFVPAMIFPVITDPDKYYYYRRFVVVPLVEDLFNDDFNRLPRPEPMPVIRGGATGGSDSVEVNSIEDVPPEPPVIEALIEEIME